MVRVFPTYHSNGGALRTTMDVSASGPDVHRIVSRFQVICRKTQMNNSFGVFYGKNPLDYTFSLILFEVIIVILITQLIRFLLKPLRQPRIVSDVIGGIFIGPSVLGQSKKFSGLVFPDNSQYVVRNVGIMGFMYFLFVSGVKMDASLIRKAGKKHVCLAIIGLVIPTITAGSVGFIFRANMDRELAKISGIGAVATNMAITAFPVIYLILRELNLLSSEIGRMALSAAIVGDAAGIGFILLFEALKQGERSSESALWYVVSSIVLGVFFVTVIRRMLIRIVGKTQEGKPVNQSSVVVILLGVLVMGFFTDMFGVAIGNGSMWLGLVIPDGPPLGTTVVERSETIVMELLMPFSFAFVGLYTDVFAMARYGWTHLAPLFAMVMTGYFSKFVVTLVIALWFDFPLKDSLTLGLIMNLRGQIEIFLYVHWMDKRIVETAMFTMMVLLTTLLTGISAPLISMLYDPTKPYRVNKRRTIQHTPPGKDLRVLVGIYGNEESVSGLIKLLEISYPTSTTPLHLSALHLIELLGRANPVFIDHEKLEEPSKYTEHETMHNALEVYREIHEENVKLHSYTAVVAKRTMYQDICKLALEEKASLIILPCAMESLDNIVVPEMVQHGLGRHSINTDVLAHAPCSVAIYVDKGLNRNPILGQSFRNTSRQYIVLFLGGADAREALTYADRMVMNPAVSLIVIRFLSYNNEGDNDLEKKLDDGVVTWFWVKNEANVRVIYKEVVVRGGDETLAAIRALNNERNDLWITGRKQGINPVLLGGLSAWGENPELGVIGDFVASVDFGSSASVLVVQQQIMRGASPGLSKYRMCSPRNRMRNIS